MNKIQEIRKDLKDVLEEGTHEMDCAGDDLEMVVCNLKELEKRLEDVDGEEELKHIVRSSISHFNFAWIAVTKALTLMDDVEADLETEIEEHSEEE